MKFLQKLKAIKAILFAEEFFVAAANQKNPYGRKCDVPIVFEYFSNTDRNIFYLSINDYIGEYIRKIYK